MKDIDPIRTILAVPMLRGDELLGVTVIYRVEVRPFAANHIALMETFSGQAVIAIGMCGCSRKCRCVPTI